MGSVDDRSLAGDIVEQVGGTANIASATHCATRLRVALHLVTAGFLHRDLSYTSQMTGVFQQLFDVLEKAFDRTIDRNTVNAARFITHLRYFFVRAHHGTQLSEGATALATAIRTSYPTEYVAATRLQAVLELRLGVPLTEDEITYLTMHVARMIDGVRY